MKGPVYLSTRARVPGPKIKSVVNPRSSFISEDTPRTIIVLSLPALRKARMRSKHAGPMKQIGALEIGFGTPARE